MAPPPTLPPGCSERYTFIRALGEGGYGSVLLARQRDLDRHVAIKILHADALSSEEQVQRFLNEARIAAALSHPNIVKIYDSGVDDAIPWIVYEFVAGQNLASVLEVGRLSLAETVRVGIGMAHALDAAHRHEILHRDVKVDNIMRTPEGDHKLTDFGIAKWGSAGTLQTKSGLIMGTPAYLAPEYIRGDPASPATDLYALGIVLYELTCGRLPFAGSTIRIVEQHLNSEPQPPHKVDPSVPVDLERIVLKLLAKEPARRYALANDLASDLLEVASSFESREGGGGPRRGPAPPAAPARSPASRSSRHDETRDLSVRDEPSADRKQPGASGVGRRAGHSGIGRRGDRSDSSVAPAQAEVQLPGSSGRRPAMDTMPSGIGQRGRAPAHDLPAASRRSFTREAIGLGTVALIAASVIAVQTRPSIPTPVSGPASADSLLTSQSLAPVRPQVDRSPHFKALKQLQSKLGHFQVVFRDMVGTDLGGMLGINIDSAQEKRMFGHLDEMVADFCALVRAADRDGTRGPFWIQVEFVTRRIATSLDQLDHARLRRHSDELAQAISECLTASPTARARRDSCRDVLTLCHKVRIPLTKSVMPGVRGLVTDGGGLVQALQQVEHDPDLDLASLDVTYLRLRLKADIITRARYVDLVRRIDPESTAQLPDADVKAARSGFLELAAKALAGKEPVGETAAQPGIPAAVLLDLCFDERVSGRLTKTSLFFDPGQIARIARMVDVATVKGHDLERLNKLFKDMDRQAPDWAALAAVKDLKSTVDRRTDLAYKMGMGGRGRGHFFSRASATVSTR